MSLFSPLSPNLLQGPKSSLLKFRVKVQDYEIFPTSVFLGLIVILAVLYYLTSPSRKLPPGPRGYPIIGNLLELRSGKWIKFTEWRKKYGDLIYLNAAGQPVVVMNTHKVAGDLLDRRSRIYSDRPRNIVVGDIMTRGLMLAVSSTGDVWRRMRKAANDGFNKSSVTRFYEKQTTEAILLVYDCLLKPAQWDLHLRRAAASTIISVVYGHPPITSEEDHILDVVKDFGDRIARAASPGTYWVEFFPWMRHIPSSLAKWKREAEAWYKQDSAMLEDLLHTVEKKLIKGDDDQSLSATLIHEAERNQLSSKEQSWVAGMMYSAGAETVSRTMFWWMLAMIAYPETQSRAQAELDAVVGRGRVPTFSDSPHLPYIRAMVKEVLRWRPASPLGVPHRLAEDDWYEGVFIPKDTICIPNVWHMNHDPAIYGDNAEIFDPARYLDKAGEDIGSGSSDVKEEGHVTYGFGRRVCTGRYMANNSMFIQIAMLLWATDIKRKTDTSGQHLPLDVDGFVDQGLFVGPTAFECEISPRFPEAPSLLAHERELRGL